MKDSEAVRELRQQEPARPDTSILDNMNLKLIKAQIALGKRRGPLKKGEGTTDDLHERSVRLMHKVRSRALTDEQAKTLMFDKWLRRVAVGAGVMTVVFALSLAWQWYQHSQGNF